MHELSVAKEIVDVVSARAAGEPIRRVVVEVGVLCCIAPDSLRFCFDLAAEGTAAAGAALEIVRPRARARCRSCGEEVTIDDPLDPCDGCGGIALDWLSGQELLIREMELT